MTINILNPGQSLFVFHDKSLGATIYKNWVCGDCAPKCSCLRSESFVETIIFAWNHEAFIIDAIESWNRQEIEGLSSLVIHDDASSDSTIRHVIARVERIHKPITVISRQTNQFSKTRFRFVPEIYGSSRAKYLAVLDGDDFWCDKDKLRVTTNALEQNSAAALVFHDFYVPLPFFPIISLLNPLGANKRDVSAISLIHENPIGALTAVFRVDSASMDFPSSFSELAIADLPIWCFLATKGPVLYLAKSMAVYRLHGSNYFGNLSKKSQHEQHRHAAVFTHDFLGLSTELEFSRPKIKIRDRLFRLRLTPFLSFFSIMKGRKLERPGH